MHGRARWVALGGLAVAVAIVQLPGPHATAWHFFDDAARLLVGHGPAGEAGGLRLFATHPEFQFGPLSVVVAVPFSLLGRTAGSWAAMGVASAAGLVAFGLLLGAVERLLPPGRRLRDATVLAAGAVAVITWGDVAVRTAHIDDAVALLGLSAALWACAVDRGGTATAALAVAVAAKPWAVVLAPLALVPSGPAPWRRLVAIAAAVAATWAPFVLADAGTLDVGDFRIANDPTSALRALGIDDPLTPTWIRPAQLAGGFVVVGAAVLAGRWRAGPALGLAWRLLLEPGAHRYYTAGVVLALLLVELRARPERLPWVTGLVAVGLEVTALPDAPDRLGGIVRLATIVAAAVVAVRLDDEGDQSKSKISSRNDRRLRRLSYLSPR